MEIYIIVAITIVVIGFILGYFKKKINALYSETPEDNKDIDTSKPTTESLPYTRLLLLSKKEWAFYKAIKPITDKYNIHILSKVRVADIIGVKKGLSNSKRLSAFGRIKAKHFDFVLARPSNLEILAAIELDDKSHEEITRQQRDYFIDEVCKCVQLPIIHVNEANDFEKIMCERLKIAQKQ